MKKGAACVIAGAGTGKTTALTARLCHLVEERQIDPSRILVTTFTRKATAELYNKAYKRLGERALQLRISTIDALVWELAQEVMHRKLMPAARLIGEAEQRVLLLQCAWEVFPPCSDISYWAEKADEAKIVDLLEKAIRTEYSKGADKRDIEQEIQDELKDLKKQDIFYFNDLTYRDIKNAIRKYFDKLNELGVIDYGSLSNKFLCCLIQSKKLAKEFASRFDAMLVDEFQDTSRVQAEILLMLSNKHRNIWVIGDPCQQIYEWRGADTDNFRRFIKKTGAIQYDLTDNFRSTQSILNAAYSFLSKRIPSLKREKMLNPLRSHRGEDGQSIETHIHTGTLDNALFMVKTILDSNKDLKPADIAILSRKLDSQTIKEIKEKAKTNRLNVQIQSSRADDAMKKTIGKPRDWQPSKALYSLYNQSRVKNLLSQSLRKKDKDFESIRTLRPLAAAANALDSILSPQSFTFKEAWPALKSTQDRDIPVTPAVVSRPDAIQVMTIHAAKGLEFPIVLLMKLGQSFPTPANKEHSRLAYVGATRARDLLILVHTTVKPRETLSAFGAGLVPIRRYKKEFPNSKIVAPPVLATPPIVAATHLNLYAQCPLKFAAYHEGRFLPEWSEHQSKGSRMHKALEYYLRAGMPRDHRAIDQCFQKGLADGDSPVRNLPEESQGEMKEAYQKLVKVISETSAKSLEIEKRYRYVHGNSGQVEGVIDALIETRDGLIVLKEWKTAEEIRPDVQLQYELQARAGVLGIAAQNLHTIQRVEIVPVSSPQKAISVICNSSFIEKSKEMLEKVFKDINDRNYEPKTGAHCKMCQLMPQCPAQRKNQ